MMDVMSGLLIPFAGTSLGAACVLFARKEMNAGLQRALTGFAEPADAKHLTAI